MSVGEIIENRISQINEYFRSCSFEFRLAIAIGMICPILYLLSPENDDQVFPSVYASRYLWTDFIPLIISIFVLIATYNSLMGRFSTSETTIVSVFTIFLIFMSVQLATTSPVGVDGWFFLENAQYFSKFGESGRAIYDSHPLVLLPVDFQIRIFGSNGRNMAMILGFLMSLYWIYVISSAVSKSETFKITGVLVFTSVGLYFLASGWYPLRYSSHLLALTLGHYLIHKESSALSYIDVAVAFFLAISHPFSPLVFGCILFIDSFSRRDRARRSQSLYLIISLIFLIYNLEGLTKRFDNLGIDILSSSYIRYILFSIPFIFLFLQLLAEKIFQPRGKSLLNTGSGVSNISVLLGCIIAIPFLLVADNQTGASRFTHRLITYSIVPLMYALDFSIFKIKEAVGSVIKKEILNLLIALLCVSNSFGVAVLHLSHLQNAEVMPENMTECWDMVEESGALAIIEENHEKGYSIVISDQTHPPLSNLLYYNFLKTGDGNRIGNTASESIIGMLEIPGLYERLRANPAFPEIANEDWVVIGEVPGACRMWLDSDLVPELDKGTTWKKLDAL